MALAGIVVGQLANHCMPLKITAKISKTYGLGDNEGLLCTLYGVL
jgi:hypothetical protein